jgi:hypothetical protein
MDAFVRSFGKLFLLVVFSSLATALAIPASCLAGGSHRGHWVCWPFVDCCTVSAWHRTWHGPYALATPLSRYYIPRTTRGCDCYGCMGWCRDVVGESYPVDWEEEFEDCPTGCCTSAMTLEPRGMERLGQIPNELELSVGGANPSPRTGR